MVNKKNNNFLIFLFFLGVLHWFFFYFFTDYYSYYKINPTQNIEIANINTHIEDHNHLFILKNKFYNDDKDLIKKIIKEKKIKFSNIFQYKKYDAHDWVKDHKIQNIVAQSLREFKMPYIVKNISGFFPIPNENFLSVPMVSFSPQSLLLYFVDSEVYTLINLILLYSIGFVGCLLIRNYYNLSIIPFIFLYLIFNFNGYVVEKYSAYGSSQMGYYFFPYIFYFLLRLSEEKNNQKRFFWSILLGLFLSLVLIQGSFHYWAELLTFVVFWSVANYKLWKASFLIYVTHFSTGFCRLLTSFYTYKFSKNPHTYEWKQGYNNLEIFISSLVSTKDQLTPEVFSSWETSLYISIIGLFLIIYFSLWAHVIKAPWRKFTGWKYFVLPCLLITIISFRQFKYYIVPEFIPMLNIESLFHRYIIFSLLLLTIIATINFQGFIEHYKNIKRINIVLIGAIISLALFLFNHSRLWRNHLVQNQFDWTEQIYPNYAVTWLKKTELVITNDTGNFLYIASFWSGILITLVSLVIFIKLLLKFNKNKIF